MSRHLLHLAAFAGYLPASAVPALAADAPTGSGVDPGILVVPFCAAFGVAFPVWGAIADRRDRRLVIAAALALLTAAGLLTAFASSTAALVAARALAGLAGAGVPPAAQAALTARTGEARAGRAIGGMIVAVALATLGGPAAAAALAQFGGWTLATLVTGAAIPAGVALAVVASGRAGRAAATTTAAPGARARLRLTPGVLAGWLSSALVLGGYWTVLTRLGEILGEDGLDAAGAADLAPLAGALGIPLVLLGARACDRLGPRTPMVAATLSGAAAFALAAVAGGPALFVAAAGAGLAVYWAYLPVVSVQVQRSATPATRGRAVGGLYASMWLGAALAGALAAAAPSWQTVVAGAAAAWAGAALVAARGFLGAPVAAPSSTPWPQPPKPLVAPGPPSRA